MSFKSKILTYSFIKEQSSIKYQALQNIQTKIRKVQKHIAKHQVSSSVAFVCGRWICHSLPTLCLNKIFEGCYKEIKHTASHQSELKQKSPAIKHQSMQHLCVEDGFSILSPHLCLNKSFESCYKEIIFSIIEECFILFYFIFSFLIFIFYFILFFLISYLEIYSSSTRQKPLCISC